MWKKIHAGLDQSAGYDTVKNAFERVCMNMPDVFYDVVSFSVRASDILSVNCPLLVFVSLFALTRSATSCTTKRKKWFKIISITSRSRRCVSMLVSAGWGFVCRNVDVGTFSF